MISNSATIEIVRQERTACTPAYEKLRIQVGPSSRKRVKIRSNQKNTYNFELDPI